MSQASSSKRSQDDSEDDRESKKVHVADESDDACDEETPQNDANVTDVKPIEEVTSAPAAEATPKKEKEEDDKAYLKILKRDHFLLQDKMGIKVGLNGITDNNMEIASLTLKRVSPASNEWLMGLTEEEKAAKYVVLVEQVGKVYDELFMLFPKINTSQEKK